MTAEIEKAAIFWIHQKILEENSESSFSLADGAPISLHVF
jgi:hypothetical protein